MDASTYQQDAARTICPQYVVLERLKAQPFLIQLNHAVVGASADLGELATNLERTLYYGQPFDQVNAEEEIGDILWYLAEACSALGVDMSAVMERNIKKLRTRFPEKFDYSLAEEQNRDRDAERRVLEGRAADDGVNYEEGN